MPRLDRSAYLFSLNCFAAAMLALFIGFALGLPRPYWAMTTAYIVSQPLSGAVRSKAAYRVMGTLLGAGAVVAIVPALVDAPVLLSLALALWVGGCLTISLLDRTPRSYLMMLAGYTAAIIGFPSVSQPGAVFEVAVSRVTEIGLGIVCATVVHSLVFPRPVGEALRRRLMAWLREADRWALDILHGQGSALVDGDRRNLAAAAGEIQILATHLPFDTSRLSQTSAAVRALHERMLLLIPLLSGVSDRIAALAAARPALSAQLSVVAAWIERGADPAEGQVLSEGLAQAASAERPRDWAGLVADSLYLRLGQMVAALGEAHALMGHICEPDRSTGAELQAVIAGAGRRRMHTDLPLALLSGAAAVIAILACCVLWIVCGWGDGAAAAVMAAVFCCFFAAMDDPVPAIFNFGLYTVISLPFAAIYMFAILPRIDGFPMLAVTLAPPLLLAGLFVPNPKTSGSALAAILGFSNALSLQENFSADIAGFLNANLGQFVGLAAAIFVTAAVRSMGAEASVRRMLGQTWRGVAQLARAAYAPAPAEFAARLVDRLGLITPKLAEAANGEAVAVGALRDLRVGMNLVTLQDVRPSLPRGQRVAVEAVMAGVGDHYAALSAGRTPHAGALVGKIDQALAAAVASPGPPDPRSVAGLVGLRRNLCPQAPAFAPPALSEEGAP